MAEINIVPYTFYMQKNRKHIFVNLNVSFCFL